MSEQHNPDVRRLLACVAKHPGGITRPDLSKILTAAVQHAFKTVFATGINQWSQVSISSAAESQP